MRLVTLKQIAAEAGVAISTTSQALSGDPTIATETRKRIQQIATRLKYRPNRLVQSLRDGRTHSIGVLIRPGISYTSGIYNGILDELADHHQIAVCLGLPTRKDGRPAAFYGVDHILELVDRRVDALICLVGPLETFDLDLFDESSGRDIPLVLVDFNPGVKADLVCTDEETGGRLVAEHLLRLGHRGMAYLAGALETTGARRGAGFVKAARAGGASVTVVEGGYTEQFAEKNRACARKLLTSAKRPTAIFAGCDEIAHQIYLEAATLSLSIPRDLSVVGFGNLDVAQMLVPPLTTVNQFPEEIGRQAVRVALGRIEGKKTAKKPIVERIKVALIERGSTSAKR